MMGGMFRCRPRDCKPHQWSLHRKPRNPYLRCGLEMQSLYASLTPALLVLESGEECEDLYDDSAGEGGRMR